MAVLGIDFGTSNTAAMLRLDDGRTRPLLFDGAPLMPTAVYLTPENQMLVGRDAERNSRVDPSRFEPNPKRRVDDGVVLLGESELSVPQVFAAVLRQVSAEAHRQLGAAPDQVRLTHPARWGEQRRRLLAEASRQAGLPLPQLIAEPVAAASYFTAVLRSAVPVGRCLAIYDLGGGTFDATVVRRTPAGFTVLAEEGLSDVGGLDFDHAIVEHLGKTYGASHPAQWASLVTPTDGNDRRYRRMLYDDVRAAKEMLSRTTSADIHLPALEVDAHLTREEFEGLVRPYLERTVVCLTRCIATTGISAKDLVGIFLVGGSSRIPLAAHLIHTELQLAPTTLEQPETVVVEGALCIGAPAPPPGAARPGHSGVPRPFTPVQPGRPGAGPQQQRPPVAPNLQPVRPPVPQQQRPGFQPVPAQGAPGWAPPGSPAPVRGPGPMRPPGGPGGLPQQPMQQPVVAQPVPQPSGPAPVSGGGPTRPAPLPPRMAPPAGPMPPPPSVAPPPMQQLAQQRPMTVPMQRPMPPPMQQPTMQQPMPGRPPNRPWYHEPAKIGTVVALVLVAALLLVLILVAIS
jgi:actin-like ATPase involved in cell morphogenesis